MAFVSGGTLLVLLVLLSLPGQAGPQNVALGTPAPALALPALDGGEVSLASLQGKPVLLNFWATWCPPCRKEMPLLESTYQRYRAAGLQVLAVNLAENPVTVRAFRDRYGITFPILLDADGKATERYRIIPLPTTFFIAGDGRVLDKVEGELDPVQLERLVTGLLQGDLQLQPAPQDRQSEIRGSPASGGGAIKP